MKVIIYIHILKSPDFNFNDPVLKMINRIKENDISVLDLDNYSSPDLIQLAGQLIQKAEKVCFLIKVSDPDSSFPFAGILEPVFSSGKDILFVVEGENPLVGKYLKPFHKRKISSRSLLTEESRVKTFLSSQEQ